MHIGVESDGNGALIPGVAYWHHSVEVHDPKQPPVYFSIFSACASEQL